MEQVSVVIVNYNSGLLLRRCVESCIDQAQQIVVIDNASFDNSLNGIEIHPSIQLVRNKKNVGFATACNQGLALTKEDYLLFLNPDCIAMPGAIRKLIQAIKTDDSIGMTGGLITNPDGSEQAGCRRLVPTPWRSFVRAFRLAKFSDRYPRIFNDFIANKLPHNNETQEVEAISGACMLVSRSSIHDVGTLDAHYFMHCEDLDWCMRYRMKSWKIVFVPQAVFVHHKGACSKNRPFFVEYHKHKGMLRFYRKFFRHQYPGILMWIVGLGVAIRFAMVAGYHIRNASGAKKENVH